MRYFKIILAMGMVVLALSGCSEDSGSQQTEVTQKTQWTIGMSQCNLGEPWRKQMNVDIEQAAATRKRYPGYFQRRPK